MKQSINLLAVVLLAFLISCTDEETNPMVDPGLYEGGVFVLNEGNFGDADASLSFISSIGVVQNNVLNALSGIKLGDVAQSMYAQDDQFFVVVNNSNKVEVVSADSLKSSYTMTDVLLPRYMTSDGDTGYLTEWVSFSDSGRVSMFDLTSGAISKSIKTGFGTEGLIISGDDLLVSNNFGSEVVIIDLTTDEITKTVEVGSSPKLMVLDKEGDIWVGVGGGSDENFAPLGDGALVEIDGSTLAVKSSFLLGANFSGKIVISEAGDTIYYTLGNEVFSFDIDNATNTLVVKAEDVSSFYGIGVSSDELIYVADTEAFEGNGTVYVYSTEGILQNTYSVGRGPNGFLFN